MLDRLAAAVAGSTHPWPRASALGDDTSTSNGSTQHSIPPSLLARCVWQVHSLHMQVVAALHTHKIGGDFQAHKYMH